MRFLGNTDWRSATSFVCFGLCIKQNRVIYLLVFDLFLVFGCLGLSFKYSFHVFASCTRRNGINFVLS